MWWIGLIVGIVAALIVAGGIFYGVWTHRKGGCSGCPGCSASHKKTCSGCPSHNGTEPKAVKK